jgi:hypothetical protein
MSPGTRVTCEDVATGESESRVIRDDWVIVTDGRVEVDAINVYSNGTVNVTLLGASVTLLGASAVPGDGREEEKEHLGGDGVAVVKAEEPQQISDVGGGRAKREPDPVSPIGARAHTPSSATRCDETGKQAGPSGSAHEAAGAPISEPSAGRPGTDATDTVSPASVADQLSVGRPERTCPSCGKTRPPTGGAFCNQGCERSYELSVGRPEPAETARAVISKAESVRSVGWTYDESRVPFTEALARDVLALVARLDTLSQERDEAVENETKALRASTDLTIKLGAAIKEMHGTPAHDRFLLRRELAEARAELERVTRERDEAVQELSHWKDCNLYPSTYRDAVESLLAAESEAAKLAQVLREVAADLDDSCRLNTATEAEVRAALRSVEEA